jgi:hypothetical protein
LDSRHAAESRATAPRPFGIFSPFDSSIISAVVFRKWFVLEIPNFNPPFRRHFLPVDIFTHIRHFCVAPCSNALSKGTFSQNNHWISASPHKPYRAERSAI